jgi:hypothetical protein
MYLKIKLNTGELERVPLNFKNNKLILCYLCVGRGVYHVVSL